VTRISKTCFADHLANYVGVGSKMHVGVNGKCLLMFLDKIE